jgi:hypothetical protein
MQAKFFNTSFRLGVAALLALTFSQANTALAQCSTDAWSNTTGSVQAIGENTNPVGKKYEQNCGLTVNPNAPGYVTTTAPTDEDFFSTRFYLYPEEMSLGNSEAVIFRARNGGTSQVELLLREQLEDGVPVKRVVVQYRDNGTLEEHGETFPLLPIWQAATVTWGAGAGTGSLSFKIDGIEKMNLTGLSNGGAVINEMDLGVISATGGSGPIVFDAFDTRRALPEPPLLTINELINISTRAQVGNGLFAVVAGFIVEGDTKKCIVVRGRGPSVNISTNKLEDPTLTLKAAGNPEVLAFNDNWQDDPNADEMVERGLAPTDPNEAAIFTCLDPGAYTAELRSVAGKALGIGIVEANDVDQGTPFLLNISTRTQVFNGSRRAVAGFAIRGTEPRTVLLRGRGPSVRVNRDRLLDPELELRQGPTVLASNNDWQDAANSSAIAATGLAPTVDEESAILITLQPGNYTVFLQSATGEGLGIGNVEVFDESGATIQAN